VIEKVSIGSDTVLDATETIEPESTPPERKAPTGTSATMCERTAA
jgi:hypothetical protein